MNLLLFSIGQIFFTGSNDLQYWRWSETKQERFQDILDFEALWNQWAIGGKLLYIQPDRFYSQPSTEDIVQRYVAYSSDAVSVRAGSYYAGFGRGLLLASVNDQELLLDRWMEGADVVGRWGPVEGEFLSGTRREIFYYTYNTYEKNTLRGARLSLTPHRFAQLTGAYVRVNYPQYDSTYMTEFKSGALHLNIPFCEAYGELVRRSGYLEQLYYAGDSTPDSSSTSYYASVNLGTKGVSLLMESKKYVLLNNDFNNPPVINHYGVYLGEELTETGNGITVSATPVKGLTLQAHRSKSWRPGTSLRVEEDYGKLVYRNIGRFKLTGSVDHALLDSVLEEAYVDTQAAVMVIKRSELAPDIEAVVNFKGQGAFTVGYTHRMRTDVAPFTVDTSIVIDTVSYTDRKLRLGLSWASLGSVWWLYSDKINQDGSCGGVWRVWQVFLHLNQNLDAMVYYGSNRAEVLCSGGICRQEPAFDGVKLWLISKF